MSITAVCDAVAAGRRDRPLGAVSEQQPVGEARELVVHRLVRGLLRAPADGGRLPPEREPQSAEREHHEPEDGLRGQSRPEDAGRGASTTTYQSFAFPVTRAIRWKTARRPSASTAPRDRPPSPATRPAGKPGAQGRADSLAPARVEDDVSRPGVDDRDVEAARLSQDGLAQRLDGTSKWRTARPMPPTGTGVAAAMTHACESGEMYGGT